MATVYSRAESVLRFVTLRLRAIFPTESMSERIRYQVNWEKAIEALAFLANERSGLSFFQVAKILYYADKEHLKRYARPILGDVYIAMTNGPVPSSVYDLLKANSFLDGDLLSAVEQAVVVDRSTTHPNIRCRRPARLEVFSASDIECLRESVRRYGDVSITRLWQLVHQERAWVEAMRNGEMSYELMIDDDVPDRDELVEEIRETAARAVV
jgi:uncharacterized phage-associated protein